MQFIDTEILEGMTLEERQKPEISRYKFFINLLMFVEFACGVGYAWETVLSMNTHWFSQLLLFVLMLLLIAVAISLQQTAFNKTVTAIFKTKTLKDDFGWSAIYVALSFVILYCDKLGADLTLQNVNSYSPNVISDYKQDKKYATASEERAKLKSEKEAEYENNNKSVNDCVECSAIRSRYSAKIKPRRSSNKPSDAKWIAKLNKDIDAVNFSIIAKRDAEIAEAKLKLKNKRDDVNASYLQKISLLDATKNGLVSRIDENHRIEKGKQFEREKANSGAAGYLSWITQLLLPILRAIVVYKKGKEGKTIHETSSFMEEGSLYHKFQIWNQNREFLNAEKAKLNNASMAIKTIDAVDSHAASFQDERVLFIAASGAKTLVETQKLLQQKSGLNEKKTTEKSEELGIHDSSFAAEREEDLREIQEFDDDKLLVESRESETHASVTLDNKAIIQEEIDDLEFALQNINDDENAAIVVEEIEDLKFALSTFK